MVVPTDLLRPPLVRILVRDAGHWLDDTPWEVLPAPLLLSGAGVPLVGVEQGGFELLSIRRACFPDADQATFQLEYGTINAVVVEPQRLVRKDVRIMLAEVPEEIDQADYEYVDPVFKTVFVGQIISESDKPRGSTTESGTRLYQCQGFAWVLDNRPMDRHAVAVSAPPSGIVAQHTVGNPGYNWSISGYFRRTIGNRYDAEYEHDPLGDLPSGTYGYRLHCSVGQENSTEWTDKQVVEHALISSRVKGDPVIDFVPMGGLFDGKFAWPVYEGESCASFLGRVLRRQRGRGVAYFDFVDTGTAINGEYGQVSVVLRAYPPFSDPLTYGIPGTNDTGVISGASALNQAIDVDLTTDPRLVSGSIDFTDRDNARYDWVETRGEPIETMVTLYGSTNGGLEKRWSSAEETAFNALGTTEADIPNRNSQRWAGVYRRFNLPRNWDYSILDPDTNVSAKCDYMCDRSGNVVRASSYTSDGVTTNLSPAACQISLDLPIYVDWNYETNPPVRFDLAYDVVPPPRIPAILTFRWGKDTTLAGQPVVGIDGQLADFNVQMDDFGMLIRHPAEEQGGLRFISGTAAGSQLVAEPYRKPSQFNAGVVTISDVAITVSIKTGACVRLATAGQLPEGSTGWYGEFSAPRRLVQTVPGIHLWLAHHSAIWMQKYNNTLSGVTRAKTPLLKNAAGSTPETPGILRDDRPYLAQIHALACKWYLFAHNAVSWSMNTCGLIRDPSTLNEWPALGQVVRTVRVGGTLAVPVDRDVDGPITAITYDHPSGRTSWVTDWFDLDLANQ